jgi:hypothetical protein
MEHESVIVVTNVGPQGPRGEKGDTAITVAVGSVTTGAPGTDATVVNSGTSKDMVLDFTIPRGAQGEQGPAGHDGETPIIITATTTDPGEGSPLANNTLLVVYDE